MLNNLLKLHKETVLLSGNGFSVDCILKPTASHKGYELKGFSTFVGVVFEDNHVGAFGDSFELTIDIEALKKKTNEIPIRGWNVVVFFEQMNGEPVEFKIENVATDRTLGMYLFKCSALTSTGNPHAAKRQSSGGM